MLNTNLEVIHLGLLTVVASGKGGTGKSTTSIGLATAFSKRGRKVLLIDLDEGLRCLDLMLGVSEQLVFDLSDILNYNKLLEEVILKVNSNIDLIAAPAEINSFSKAEFGKFLYKVTDIYDNVIVDCPAGIDVAFYKSIPPFADVLIVESLDMIGCRSASVLYNLLDEAEVKHKYLIINKFDYFMLKRNPNLTLDEIIDKSGLMLKGIIPLDTGLGLLSASGKLYFKSYAFKAFLRIANRLEGKNIPLPSLNNL